MDVCKLHCIIWKFGLHYAKRSTMSWVVVIPKEGWAGNPSTDFLDFFFFFFFFWNFYFFFFKSVAYQKKGGRGPAHPSFFWYDNDSGHCIIWPFGLRHTKKVPNGLSWCHNTRTGGGIPSCGVTPTRYFRELFVWNHRFMHPCPLDFKQLYNTCNRIIVKRIKEGSLFCTDHCVSLEDTGNPRRQP